MGSGCALGDDLVSPLEHNAADYVIELNGRYALARWVESAGQYQAPMTREARRLTGCHTVSSRTKAGIFASANVHIYSTRRVALAAARRMFGAS